MDNELHYSTLSKKRSFAHRILSKRRNQLEHMSARTAEQQGELMKLNVRLMHLTTENASDEWLDSIDPAPGTGIECLYKYEGRDVVKKTKEELEKDKRA